MPEVIADTFDVVRKGGRVILYGLPSDEDRIEMPVTTIIMNQLEVYGAVGNPKVWEPLLEMIASGRISLKEMVTHEFSLNDISKAFSVLDNREGDPIKIVIDPWKD